MRNDHPTRLDRNARCWRSLRQGLLLSIVCGLFSLGADVTQAHVMPQTAVMLDFERSGVSAEMILPLQDLQSATNRRLVADQDSAVIKDDSMLRDYILERVRPVAPDGRPWTVKVERNAREIR